MIEGALLIARPTSDITVTRVNGKPDKAGMYQVFGFRTGDTKLRMVTFFVWRKEAQEIIRDCSLAGPADDFVAEVDTKAWAFVHAPGGVL